MSAETVITFTQERVQTPVVLRETILSPAPIPVTVQSEGVLVGRRGTLNFTENVSAPEDDPANNRTNVPVGGGSGVGGYNHTQGSASTTWTVNHNLGRVPIVELRSVGGVLIEADVTHTSINQTVIQFATAQAGTARFV